MSYSIRRFDGRFLRGLSAHDVRRSCEHGDLWPDEELSAESPGTEHRWVPLSSVPKLADALRSGEPLRTKRASVHPEQLAADHAPAVVHVVGPTGTGTGFAIDADGLVITNEHVVSDATVCRVRFHNGLEAAARVILRSDRLDLAALKCALPTPSFVDPNARRPGSVRQGAHAYVLGYPGQVDAFSVTVGLVSATSVTRDGGRWHQVSAPVNPGNSGGPVLGERGELIGIATQRENAHSDGRHTEGIAWAIPFEEVCGFTKHLWSEIAAGRVRVPSAADLMRECNRPDPAHEVQLAVRRLVRDSDFRVVESKHFKDGPLHMVRLAGPEGENVTIVIDRYPFAPEGQRAPWYLYMYSMLGDIPEPADGARNFRKRVLERNMVMPHWQFAESEGRLLLRYCRQADLLDASEVLHVVEDLHGVLNFLLDDE